MQKAEIQEQEECKQECFAVLMGNAGSCLILGWDYQTENSLIQGLEQEEHDRKATAYENIGFF